MKQSDSPAGRRQYFETLYQGDADPWRYEDGPYEIAKRADTLTFLRDRYASACEIGCSIGVLTDALAGRCDHLIGFDVSQTAADLARRRLAGHRNVEIQVRHLPHEPLVGSFDLLVLSEVLYFFDETELADLAAMATRCVVPGGEVLVVSYDGDTQTRLDGPASTSVFLRSASTTFELLRSDQREHYHIRLLRRIHDAS